MSNEKTDAQRLQMINGQVRTCDVNDLDILTAFATVPREDFVAGPLRSFAYGDGDIPSSAPPGRKLLSARSLGLMLKTADPAKGESALTVGAGSGYCAALLAALGLDVVALETEPVPAIAGVVGAVGPLTEPPAGAGPFDIIIINGAFEVPPVKLIAALKEGGRLVGIGAVTEPKQIVVYERSGGGISQRALYDAAGDVLPGLARAPEFAF